jgi:hypothetical protein
MIFREKVLFFLIFYELLVILTQCSYNLTKLSNEKKNKNITNLILLKIIKKDKFIIFIIYLLIRNANK